MALGSGMIFLDSTAVNVALPRIQTDLAAPLAGLQWVVNAFGFLYLMTIGRQSDYLTGFFPGIVLVGLGMATFVTPLTATVMAALPEGPSGIASGVNDAATRVASLLAIAVLGVIVTTRFDATFLTLCSSVLAML
jgi:hypothetical protein